MLRRATRFLAAGCLITAAVGAERGVWLDVPFVPQVKNGCGAASIAMVMQYWERQQARPGSLHPEVIQRALYSRQARGIYAWDLERYLRQLGFRTFAFKGDWSDLRQHLEKGRPLIVALNAGAPHYVVVTGMDWVQEIVMKHDPAQRKLVKQHRSDFEKDWKATGNWALLAVPEQTHSR